MDISIHRPDQTSEPHIQFSDKALAHFQKQLTSSSHSAVRLSVRRSGCSGYRYELSFVKAKTEGDIDITQSDIPIFVDKDAISYLDGIVIDLVTKGLNHQISYHNPNASATCGCGESFAVEPIDE